MPNWCQNTLTVECPDHPYLEMFARQARGADGSPLSLAALYPEPGDPNDSSYDWYSWRVDHWGCKWDLSFDGPGIALVFEDGDPENSESGMGLTEKVGALDYSFLTPYGPPVEGFQKVSRDFPEARFIIRYAEAGMEIAGEIEIFNGQIVRDDSLEISEVLGPGQMWF